MRVNLAACSILALSAGLAHAGSSEFTDDADWDLGTYNSTNSGPPGVDNQIQLYLGIAAQFDHLWVAASGRGTAIQIDTKFNDGDDGVIGNNNHAAVLGENYFDAALWYDEFYERLRPAKVWIYEMQEEDAAPFLK